jgi:hypothetical protein
MTHSALAGGTLVLCLSGLCASLAAAEPATPSGGSEVRVGKGGYTLVVPQTKDRLPENPYITERVQGPLPSTGWATSIHWQQYSTNHYAHPLAMRAEIGRAHV